MNWIKDLKPMYCLVLLCLLLSGCFRRFQMTEREVRAHYAGRSVKPRFHTLETDSTKLFVASIGADTLPPLLLIHGAPGAWYGYLRMLDDSLLQQRYHILSIERPGYGKSRKRRRAVTSINQQAACISQALSLNCSRKPAVVLGRSYGAPIAARLATLHPDRVGHLYLVSAAIDPDKEKFFWFSGWGRMPFVKLFLPRSLNIATAEKYSHAAELRQLLPCWTQLCMPVTVMQGGKDWIIDPGNFDFARRVLANTDARFIYLPDAGHVITSSHHDLVEELLLNTADSLYRQSALSARRP